MEYQNLLEFLKALSSGGIMIDNIGISVYLCNPF